MSKLCAADWIDLLNKTTTSGQIKSIVECLDACWQEDNFTIDCDGWVAITTSITLKKIRIEGI